jgi:hypothetical protein
LGFVVLTAQVCAFELNEATAKAATRIVEVKILLITISLSLKDSVKTAISRRNWEGFSRGITDYYLVVIAKDMRK